MVSALPSGSNCLGSSPGWGHCVMVLCKMLSRTLSVPFSTKVKKGHWQTKLGGKPCNGLASHPGGSRSTPGHFIGTETGLMATRLVCTLYLLYCTSLLHFFTLLLGVSYSIS